MPLKIKPALYYVPFPENVFLHVFSVYTHKKVQQPSKTIPKQLSLKYIPWENMTLRSTCSLSLEWLHKYTEICLETIYFLTSTIGLEESKSNAEKRNGILISSFCPILSPKWSYLRMLVVVLAFKKKLNEANFLYYRFFLCRTAFCIYQNGYPVLKNMS